MPSESTYRSSVEPIGEVCWVQVMLVCVPAAIGPIGPLRRWKLERLSSLRCPDVHAAADNTRIVTTPLVAGDGAALAVDGLEGEAPVDSRAAGQDSCVSVKPPLAQAPELGIYRGIDRSTQRMGVIAQADGVVYDADEIVLAGGTE